VHVSADLGDHAAHLGALLDCGVDELVVHHVPRPQSAFIDAFGEKVLPELSS
jgi:hypothetical protein